MLTLQTHTSNWIKFVLKNEQNSGVEKIQISMAISIKNGLKMRYPQKSEITETAREKVTPKQITTVICSPILMQIEV